jgi:dienelactone hydrolase
VAIDTIEVGRGGGAIRASRAMPADGDVGALAVVLPEIMGESSATWAYGLLLAVAGFCALAPEPASLGVSADRSRPQHLNEAVATARIGRLVAHVRGMQGSLPVFVAGTGGGGRLVWRAAGADLRDFAFYCGSGCTDALAPIAWPHTLRWLRDA